MFKSIILASAAALAFASAAHADDIQQALTQAPVQQTIVAPTVNANGGNATATAAPSSATASATAAPSSATASAGSATVNQDYQRAPVATAYAAPLSFSQGTCYVSASAGGQGITFGLSMAVPFEDKACTARATAQALNALGERAAALRYLAAHDKGVAVALGAQ